MNLIFECSKCGKELETGAPWVGFSNTKLQVAPCTCQKNSIAVYDKINRVELIRLLEALKNITFEYRKRDGELRTINGNFVSAKTANGKTLVFVYDQEEEVLKSLRIQGIEAVQINAQNLEVV